MASKRKTSNLGFIILAFLTIVLGALAVIFMVLPFEEATLKLSTFEGKMTLSGFALAFNGNAVITTKVLGSTSQSTSQVGSTNAGLISAFSLATAGAVLALLALVLTILKKTKLNTFLTLLAGLTILTAGILFLCVGPLTGAEAGDYVFAGQKVGEAKIGLGAILSGVFGIIGGLTGLLSSYLAYKK